MNLSKLSNDEILNKIRKIDKMPMLKFLHHENYRDSLIKELERRNKLFSPIKWEIFNVKHPNSTFNEFLDYVKNLTLVAQGTDLQKSL